MASLINKVKSALKPEKENVSNETPMTAENGPHDSAVANKLDPRVDSDADGSNNAGMTETSATSAPVTGGAIDDGAPDSVSPRAALNEPGARTSGEYGLDASKHKPSKFAQHLGTADIMHSKDSTHQRRHGSVSGHEHYGSGIQ